MENEANTTAAQNVEHESPRVNQPQAVATKPPLAPSKWKPCTSRKRKRATTKTGVSRPLSKKKTPGGEGVLSTRRTSWAWDHFTEYKENDGEIRARCNYCIVQTYAAQGKLHGTGNMITHLELKCPKYLIEKLMKSKKTLGIEAQRDDNGAIFVTLKPVSYCPQNCRSLLVKMVIIDELSFRFVEGEGFKMFVYGLQPKFTIPNRFTIAKNCIELYTKEKTKLKKLIKSERVCLTTDSWTSIQSINYMCITGHWIDKDWKLQKRILNFSVIPNHNGKTIRKKVETCMVEWGIDQFLTITVDNASSNDSAIKYLKKKTKDWKTTIFEHEFIHLRCAAHSLNIMVKDGLKQHNESILKIRNSIRYIRSSPARVQAFKTYADIEKIDSKSLLCLDIKTRWNSTYLMLETALKFVKAFERMKEDDFNYQKYFLFGDKDDDDDDDDDDGDEHDRAQNVIDDENEGDERHKSKDKYVGPPGERDLEVARHFVKFLKLFYYATLHFSSSLQVTSNLFFDEIVTVQTKLRNMCRQKEKNVKVKAEKMHEKFTKYWKSPDRMNYLLYIATVLDPRFKMKFVKFCFTQLYENDVSLSGTMVDNVRKVLFCLYECYEKSNLTEKNGISTSSQTHMTEVDLDDDMDSGGSLAFLFAKELEENESDKNKSELFRYLDESCEKNSDFFDILKWWKDNSSKFPILSQLARDILAMHVTTISSESAFSTSGRLLDPYRSSLSPNMVEVLVCCQNWLRAESYTIDIQDSMKEVPISKVEKYEDILNEFQIASSSKGK